VCSNLFFCSSKINTQLDELTSAKPDRDEGGNLITNRQNLRALRTIRVIEIEAVLLIERI
jgi:hypothetical protein